MPLVTVLAIAARWLLKYIITKSLIFLGIAYVAFTGLGDMIDRTEQVIYANLAGLPADVFNMAMLCGFGEYVTITLSSFAGYLTLKGMRNGVKYAMQLNPLL
ncbi:DUF2523 domain-containing protein [Marinihelvus fidelis]|uniref:DUF2523 domain-containing protein n=1 Tax=Marinihelvus fidelis TaxID=2613842 RepID=A0A5N0TBB9_9GAMM|nr:DUF2523 family protein [Marinihelvus fidelis]KAA9131968.1 DUF2523 domain-containing protein [Marinihelvus fidelis]